MKFFKGTVEGSIDSSQQGLFSVNILEKGTPSVVTVNYVSHGGITAVPPTGSEVLIAFDESLGEYFYFGTIAGKNKFSKEPTPDKEQSPKVTREYNKENISSRVSFTNSDGAGLKISNYLGGIYSPTVKSVVLESIQGHRLELSDTPTRDQVALKNKNQEGITITGDASEVLEGRCIEIKTLNSIRNRAVQGEIRVDLTHGRDITIKNGSDGLAGGIPIPTPIGPVNPIPAGNLNLVTSWKDINIYTENLPNRISGDAGRILISTPQGLIQLKSGSDGLTIYSEGNINVASVRTQKTILVDSLGSDPVLNTPNLIGTLESWIVQPGQSFDSGDILATISVGTTSKSSIPVVSPYKGVMLSQLFQINSNVFFKTPIAIIETAGGNITLEASDDITLKAGGKLNFNSNLGVDMTSFGPIEAITPQTINLNGSLGAKIESTTDVAVVGSKFTMAAITSNIVQSNGGGPIYAPQVVPQTPVEVTPILPISVIPEIGPYALSKQP